jgi:hypothetical protein
MMKSWTPYLAHEQQRVHPQQRLDMKSIRKKVKYDTVMRSIFIPSDKYQEARFLPHVKGSFI